MKLTNEDIIEGVLRGNRRAVARLITLVENQIPRGREMQAALFKRSGRAHVIGITGAPGAGKSTLVDQLAAAFRKRGKKVAILAIDPTSPFTGGAVLGDRIRMSKSSEDPEIFIRSMATRGSLGGLSRATLDAIHILDAAGFDLILIETVGVGQAEVDIVRTADTCVVVLVPGMGDGIQVIKAGIIEIGDVFVINKSDREGADLVHRDLRMIMSLEERKPGEWEPPIVKTVASAGTGTGDLCAALEQHAAWLKSSASGKKRKLDAIRESIFKLASDRALEKIEKMDQERFQRYVLECFERKRDPQSVVDEIFEAGF